MKRSVWAAVLTVVAVGCSGGHSPMRAPKPSPGRVGAQPSAHDEILVLDDGLDIVAVDANAHVISVRPIEIADSFDIASVTDQTIVLAAADSTVRTVPLAGGVVRVIGSGLPINGTQPGTLWITGSVPMVRLVDTRGHVLVEERGPPEGRQGACLDCPGVAVAAVPGALVFQTDTGFDIWDTKSSRVTRHLGTQPGHAGPAFGSTLPWCADCARAIELTDVGSGKTKEVPLSIDGSPDALLSALWSPDGTHLAIPELVDAGRTAKVILVDVAAARATELGTVGDSASVAWSRDGQRLYVASPNGHETRLSVRDVVTGSTRDLGAIAGPATPTLHLAAVISTQQAAYLLGTPRVASLRRCAVRLHSQESRSDGCSYRY